MKGIYTMKIESNTSLESTMSKFDIQQLIEKEAAEKGMDVQSIEWKATKTKGGKLTKLDVHLTGTPNKNFKKQI